MAAGRFGQDATSTQGNAATEEGESVSDQGESYEIDRMPKTPAFVDEAWPQMETILIPIYLMAANFMVIASLNRAKAMMANWLEVEDVSGVIKPEHVEMTQMYYKALFGRDLDVFDANGEPAIQMTADEAWKFGGEMLRMQLANVGPISDSGDPE